MSPAANSAFSVSTSLSARARPSRLPDASRVVVGEPWTAWRDPVMERLETLIQLPTGWDGYGAPPVRLENAYFAMLMLRAICGRDMAVPQIVPGSAGDLQVEWHSASATIELHVKAPNRVSAWRQTAAVPDGEEIELSNDFKIVLHWVREMLGDGIAAVTAAA
jgi:hypothetical protein